MKKYNKVKSTVKPLEIEILETKVFVASNIIPITEQNEEHIFEGFEYDLTEYDKDEYIKMQSENTDMLTQCILELSAQVYK